MRNKAFLLLIIIGSLAIKHHIIAQEMEPGGFWSEISVEKEMNKRWSLGTSVEHRTNGMTLERERLGLQFSSAYQANKNMKFAIAYTYLNVLNDYRYSPDSVREHYQDRHRTYIQGTWKYKMGNFTFFLRERAQMTFKDESSRITSTGAIRSNRVNPDFLWRNRMKLSYKINNFPITPSVSVESYYLLNDPIRIRFYDSEMTDFTLSNRYFSKIRYNMALSYKINKTQSIELFGMYLTEREPTEVRVPGPNYYILSPWLKDMVLGVNYDISF